ALEKPRRPRRLVEPVRPEARRMDDAADGARCDQLARLHRRAGLEMLGEADRIDALRLGLDGAHRLELVERGDAGLVGHEVLAVAHRLDAEGRALRRDAGADDELDRLVLKDAAL